jgi:hypothetical protein
LRGCVEAAEAFKGEVVGEKHMLYIGGKRPIRLFESISIL